MHPVTCGCLRALGVTGANRLPLLAEVPTVAEGGLAGYASSNWFGLMLPIKTPKEVVAAIHRATIAVLNKSEVVKRLKDLGNIPVGNTPEEFGALIKSEIALLADVFRKAGVEAN
ncbi:MAG: tripartite tricarboxylate transporter substrate-binding protein [Pseudomonadota bacterium]